MHAEAPFRRVVKSLDFGAANVVCDAPEGVDGVFVTHLRRHCPDRDILVVLPDEEHARRLAGLLEFLGAGASTRLFPAWDCLPYDRVSPNPAVAGERLTFLGDLADGACRSAAGRTVLTTARCLLQRVPSPEAWEGRRLHLSRGDERDPVALVRSLTAMGYTRTGVVMEPGDCSVRGDILDIHAPAMEAPIRIDFFGDEITGLRTFDPLTQRSTGDLDRVVIDPASEAPLDAAAIERFREGWRELFGIGSVDDPLYESVAAGQRSPGMEHWLALFHERLVSLDAWLKDDWILVFAEDVDLAMRAHLDTIDDHYAHRQEGRRADEPPYRAVPPDRLHLAMEDWEAMAAGRTAIRMTAGSGRPEAHPARVVSAGGVEPRDFQRERLDVRLQLFEALAGHIAGERARGRRVIVAALSAATRDSLAETLERHGVGDIVRIGDEGWREAPPSSVAVAVLDLECGFTAGDLCLIAERDILGKRYTRPRRQRSRKDAERFLLEVSQVAEGDHVVHIDHGIGMFEGLHTVTLGGAPHDCLRILYAGGDALLVPVENIDTLSHYGSQEARVQLDRLGSASWQARQARLARRIEDIAGDLLKVASERLMERGPRVEIEQDLYREFCSRFPFQETGDQEKAIAEVIDDLGSGRAMDRLVCGDVGFGKTEVALRAALAAVLAGHQVAVVAPTTLLARQHHETFLERFRHLPVHIAQLSRLVAPAEARETLKDLAAGRVDIVIGTHALLSSNVAFSGLGLLVIDEEQQFGVKQKERLKQLKASVHVLTLTATPIPRTLQMALSGVRDLSLIVTPPVDRLAIKTFVGRYDSVTVKEAVRRERLRGGQTYVVCPRIADLKGMLGHLENLVPGARVAVAHGRMDAESLERIMTAFYDGRVDVLVCTSIIQSGLDVPNANTMIVHRADRFGLAQLHQLRGRIGRSRVRAYAYITYEEGRELGKNAQRRLKALSQLDSLGAGFSLASHDLEIRGAGNLLGRDQSGHIREVGVELYQKMLEEAVEKARAEREGRVVRENRSWSPEVGIGSAVLIPDSWVSDLDVRLVLYRRIAALDDERDIQDMREELCDRFGPLPEEADNLLRIVAIKGHCRKAGITRLDAGFRGALVSFHERGFANPGGLVAWLAQGAGTARLRPDQKLVVTRNWDRVSDRLEGAELLASTLASIAGEAEQELQRLG